MNTNFQLIIGYISLIEKKNRTKSQIDFYLLLLTLTTKEKKSGNDVAVFIADCHTLLSRFH
jgi:hypothetical protein